MAKKRPDGDPQRPAPHEAPAPAPAGDQHHEEPRPAILPASKASIALWQLEGLAEAIGGIAGLARDGAAALAKVDVRPPRSIGSKRPSDYVLDAEAGHLVLSEHGRPVACNEFRHVDWEEKLDLGDDPEACRKLSGRQIQRQINAVIKKAREAAGALCTDGACENHRTSVLYQEWSCPHFIDEEGRWESSLRVVIQLQLQCVRNL